MADQRVIAQRLAERRHRAAEHRCRCYDFGGEVLSRGRWTQHGRDGGHWRQHVTVRTEAGEVAAIFAITFATNTNHMIEAYAQAAGVPFLLVGRWSDEERRTP